MADQPEKKPSRTAADKERSRQQSRPVSGRDAKSGGGQSKGAGNGPGGKSGTGPGRGPQQAKGGAGGRSAKPQTGKGGAARQAPPPPRRSSAPFIWGAVALVLVFVIIIVLVTVTGGGGSSGSDSQGGNPVSPAPASIVKAVTTVPDSAFDAVGVNSGGQQLAPPTAVKNKASFQYDGKPGFLYFGAEFCPYCAAERWALVTSLARFGTFSHLDVTKSNSKDTDPGTATFSFRNAFFQSPYLGVRLIENETGDHAVLQTPTAQEAAILKAFNVSGYPFIDVGNKYQENSPEYDPALLHGLSWSDIASNLHDPTNPITQTILASSNYISAAICAANGGKPESVCKSKGVEAATKALNSSSSSG
jgi:hypothetical protein